MKNLLGRKVKLNGDNYYNYTGESRIVGYGIDESYVIVEMNNIEGWNKLSLDGDDNYIDNYEIPNGYSLMAVGDDEYELID